MFTESNDIPVKVMPLPEKVRGFTICLEDSTYCIVLNARHSREENILAYSHEVQHIMSGDFERFDPVDHIEAMRH